MSKPYAIYGREFIDEAAVSDFYDALKQPYSICGALMPDAHKGYALPIGAVVATDNFVVPAWVGYDQGCGMCALRTNYSIHDILDHRNEIFERIYQYVPVGFNVNKRSVEWKGFHTLERSGIVEDIIKNNGARKMLGTLGGGNHFIEIGHDEYDRIWIIIHSGSRGLGHKTATAWMKLASNSNKAKEGHYGFPADSTEGKNYIKDMNFCKEFALENRLLIARRVDAAIADIVGDATVFWSKLINKAHNYAEYDSYLNGWVHRKGATDASRGTFGVIPGNMRDGAFIVKGLGNPDSLFSSSHGAGRVGSRKQAKENIKLDDFVNQMEGITAKVTASTIDESPDAYKNINTVMDLQKDLVDVIHHIKPIINIKG